jgi:hypothetical protein
MKPPRIESYQFGQITIDGHEYSKDVIILPDRVISNWWRRSGHRLILDDLKEVLDSPPRILVIGRGSASRMQVPNQTVRALESGGIEVQSLPTQEACTLYNQLRSQDKTAAALHLTC